MKQFFNEFDIILSIFLNVFKEAFFYFNTLIEFWQKRIEDTSNYLERANPSNQVQVQRDQSSISPSLKRRIDVLTNDEDTYVTRIYVEQSSASRSSFERKSPFPRFFRRASVEPKVAPLVGGTDFYFTSRETSL